MMFIGGWSEMLPGQSSQDSYLYDYNKQARPSSIQWKKNNQAIILTVKGHVSFLNIDVHILKLAYHLDNRKLLCL